MIKDYPSEVLQDIVIIQQACLMWFKVHQSELDCNAMQDKLNALVSEFEAKYNTSYDEIVSDVINLKELERYLNDSK